MFGEKVLVMSQQILRCASNLKFLSGGEGNDGTDFLRIARSRFDFDDVIHVQHDGILVLPLQIATKNLNELEH